MPPQLQVEIVKRLGRFTLDIQLTAGPEILVLFGPSGAGKTQTLQAIAGLITPDHGSITLDDTVFYRHRPGARMVNLPARKRRIGYVFQQYALFPHMTALANVAFPLAGQSNAEARARELLARMRLEHLAHRMPQELSGGQQQRIAIARALAAEPRVLLFDEAFSALDRSIREQLHADLRALQEERQLIVLYVTHNLDDAFAVGHRLAVVRDGRVEQVGPLDDVYTRPANRHVLEILGIPNAITAQVIEASAAGLLLDWDGLVLAAPPLDLTPGAEVTAYIRPEDIRLIYPDRPLNRMVRQNVLNGTVIEHRRGRHVNQLRVKLAGRHMIDVVYPATSYSGLDLSPGRAIHLALRVESIVIIAPRQPVRPVSRAAWETRDSTIGDITHG
ncbi:MAG TPA: ABC transporter ATP-binding protein [Roseiflexaceae bacterium]|nr:ABC transporter ATP-binding protein [Roseiflexaceae bacterium]